MRKIFFSMIFLIIAASIARCAEQLTTVEDIVFGKYGGIVLKADAIMPPGEGPFPIVVAAHGGGFVRGDKKDIDWLCRRIAPAGYVVFNANYRTVTDGALFPDFVKDINSAVRWIRKHAAEYKGDPEKIALLGVSAGSYIASLAAVTPHVEQFRNKDPELDGVSSQVAAVVPFYGHQNIEILDDVQMQTARLIWGKDLRRYPKLLKLASPVYYIDHAAPTLLFHCTGDPLVPVEQSRSMFEIYSKAGLPVYYYEFPEHAHDLLKDDYYWALDVTTVFLDKYTKNKINAVMPDTIPPREK